MKDKKKNGAFEAILKWLHDSKGHLVKEISKALNTTSRKLQYSMPTKNSRRSETDKSKGHRDKKNVHSTDDNLFFGMSMVVIIMLLFASVGVVSALTITEDYTVIENQIINEDLTLDGASYCTIRNNIIHGELWISNFSESNTISNNTVDELIVIHESAYNTLRGNHMGGFITAAIGSGTSPKYRYDQDIDTSNLVKGKPLYFYFDIHDTVIENLTNIGQLYMVVSSHVTIRNLNMDRAGIVLKACDDCIITDCVVSFTTDPNVGKVGYIGVILDNCNRATVKNSTITISGSVAWGIFGDTIPNSEFSNNIISVSGGGWNTRGFHIYCSWNVKITGCTITAPDNAFGAITIAYGHRDGMYEIISSDVGHVHMCRDQGQDPLLYPLIKTIFTNTRYSSIGFCEGERWIAYRLWYLDAKVLSSGTPVQGAIVTATDKYGVEAFSVTTDANGNIPQQSLLDYTQTATETTYSAPYTITATKSGQSDSKSIDLTESTTVDLNLGEVPPDTIPPAAVTDLATGNPTSNSITLTWTAPGDDGVIGTASQYDIRYSTTGISEANWNAAIQCAGEPTPQVAGSAETFTVTSLSSNTTYHFALKTADEVPNWSGVSNSPSGTTTEIVGGLIGHWKFDEGEGTTAHDSSGEGNDGTIYGASWTTGILGSALAFDGYNDYVDCGNDARLNINGTKTISIWLKISEWAQFKAPWSKYLDGSNRVSFQTWTDPKIRLFLVDEVTTINMPTDIINIDEWTQVVVTIDESSQVAKIYQNGSYINQDTSFTLPDTFAANFIIGSAGAGGRYFNGAIDDVRVYNYALSDAEVLALYQGGVHFDTIPPYTTGHSPAKDAIEVAKNTTIVVHVRDDGAGVDISSIVMTVNGITVTPIITGTPADYTLTYVPSTDFECGQVVNVTVDADDLATAP